MFQVGGRTPIGGESIGTNLELKDPSVRGGNQGVSPMTIACKDKEAAPHMLEKQIIFPFWTALVRILLEDYGERLSESAG